jgi:hypothetical protein
MAVDADDNDVRVTAQGRLKSYVSYILNLFASVRISAAQCDYARSTACNPLMSPRHADQCPAISSALILPAILSRSKNRPTMSFCAASGAPSTRWSRSPKSSSARCRSCTRSPRSARQRSPTCFRPPRTAPKRTQTFSSSRNRFIHSDLHDVITLQPMLHRRLVRAATHIRPLPQPHTFFRTASPACVASRP